MSKFNTLLWLEYRRSRVWAAALIGSLAFWAWGIQQVQMLDLRGCLGVRTGLLGAAAMIGALVLCLMIGRIRAEMRHGQYQVLLMSPPNGYVHIAARYAYVAGVAMVYYIAIGFLYWWIAEKVGIHLDPRSLTELVLAVPFYAVSVTVLPLLAWTLLLMVFISAYRISGPGWIPATVMILGTPFAVRWFWEWLVRISYTLPSWRLFENAIYRIVERISKSSDAPIPFVEAPYQGVPLEPMLAMLALTVLMLFVAGRIWQEVEG